MATEEIEISQLELAEDLIGDMVMPVETSTDTKATTLTKFKDWLKGFFVSKTGDETIAGTKTFTGTILSTASATSFRKDTNVDSTIAPSTYNEVVIVQNNDKNGVLNTSLRTGYSTNGDIQAHLYTRAGGVSHKISVIAKPDGTGYATAPTPGVESNGDIMATTAWHNNKHKVISALPSNPSSSVFYYIPE